MDEIIDEIDEKDPFTLILFNTKENLKTITDNWNKIKDFPKLTIIFVNSLSETEHKWILHPYTHDKITEQPVLASGLKTIAENIGFTTKYELEQNI